jgi:hypothetical protein
MIPFKRDKKIKEELIPLIFNDKDAFLSIIKIDTTINEWYVIIYLESITENIFTIEYNREFDSIECFTQPKGFFSRYSQPLNNVTKVLEIIREF